MRRKNGGSKRVQVFGNIAEGEIREKVMKGRCVIGSLAAIMRGRNMSMEVNIGLKNIIFMLTLTYRSETWT